jgi:membrane protein
MSALAAPGLRVAGRTRTRLRMPTNDRGLFDIIKATFRSFLEDECPVRAAALAYYTVFALPPLLILLIMLVGMIWDPADVQRALETQFAGMIGQSGAEQIRTIIAESDRPGGGGVFATAASIGALLFGATGAFMQLQGALNRAWEVKPDPDQGGVRNFIVKRMLSLGMVFGIGFLLAVSLALTSAVSAFGDALFGGMPEWVMHAINFALTFVVLALLFAATFKFLPDAAVAWRDVWIGGGVTALLFVAGKFAIGFYLGRSSPGEAFGAAAALAVILIWAYYAGMIILLGAEFTQEWARSRGEGIEPEEGAVRVVRTEEQVGGEESGARGPRGATSAPPAPEKKGLMQTLLGAALFVALTGRKRRE